MKVKKMKMDASRKITSKVLSFVVGALSVVGCASDTATSTKSQEESFFDASLTSVRDVPIARLNKIQEDALRLVASRESLVLVNENGEEVYSSSELGARGFKNMADFFGLIAKSASEKSDKSDNQHSSFRILQQYSCGSYEAKEKNFDPGSSEIIANSDVQYTKTVTKTDAGIQETVNLEASGSGSYGLKDCRDFDWDTREKLLGELAISYPIDAYQTKYNAEWKQADIRVQIGALDSLIESLTGSGNIDKGSSGLSEEDQQKLASAEREKASLLEREKAEEEALQLAEDQITKYEEFMQLMNDKVFETSQNRNGSISFSFKSKVSANADQNNRKNWYELPDPWENGNYEDEDLRLSEATDNIGGLAQTQIQLSGSTTVEAYDPESNTLVPVVVSANNLIIGGELSAENMHDLISLTISGMLDEATRRSETQDILLNAFKCSGDMSFKVGDKVESFSCQSLIKKAVVQGSNTIRDDDY